MPRTSWKAMADRLAGRLANHAFCETHALDRPGPDCPFCDDRTAYAEYIAAGGRDHRPMFDGGVTLSFAEWKALAETSPVAPTGGEDSTDGD